MKAFLRLLASVGHTLSDLLWPPVCAACGTGLALRDQAEPAAFYCQSCLSAIEFMPESLCPRCGRPYWGAPAHLCGDCLGFPPPYDSARSAVVYGGEAAHSILKLKYHGNLSQAKPLAALCHVNSALMAANPAADIIIPMPLTPERLAHRGFNQAFELAVAVYGPTAPPIRSDILERTHDGHRRLATLSAKERRQAVKGCFRVSAPEKIQGAHILLFDDILTTGSTAGEAARTLLAAGAAQVDLRTIARAIPRDWR